jgi:hypothetical protein
VLGVPDTHAPTAHLLTIQGDKANGTDTPIRVQLRDNDNYYVIGYYDVDLFYTVDTGVENRIRMVSQGSQQFQATIPGGINGTISYYVSGSDGTGNTFTAFSGSPIVYTQTSSGTPVVENLDDGTPGVNGNPYLEGKGSFVAGSTVSFPLREASPFSLAVLFASIASVPTPFKGGLLYTTPIAVEVSLQTSASSGCNIVVVWPVSLPIGAEIWIQYGILDRSSIYNGTLSNAVHITQP